MSVSRKLAIWAAAALVVSMGLFGSYCEKQYSDSDPVLAKPLNELTDADVARMVALVQTNYGEFKIGLLPDKAPMTCRNFVKLVRSGFYDGLTFYEVRPGIWMVGGDPKGDGTGGPGYTIELEPSDIDHVKGVVGMYHPVEEFEKAGSQFYVMLGKVKAMNKFYSAFGKVVDGMSTVERIGALAVTPRDGRPRPYMPLSPVVIKKISLVAAKQKD